MNLDQFQASLATAIRQTGAQMTSQSADVAAYARQRAAHLATIAGQAGFEEALVAERDAVLLFAGLGAVRLGDASDAQLLGLIHGALLAGAAAV